MSWLHHEWRLLARSRLALAALVLLLGLSTVAVISGLQKVVHERHDIDRLKGLAQTELQVQQQKYARGADAGSVAYYTFMGTWDAPASAAFLALGLRDTSPYVMRVRALALQAQLHEGESFNPEVALAGRFDFAFVLVYLAPLFIIALLYDLVSSERAARRLATLQAMPRAGRALWLRRDRCAPALSWPAWLCQCWWARQSASCLPQRGWECSRPRWPMCCSGQGCRSWLRREAGTRSPMPRRSWVSGRC